MYYLIFFIGIALSFSDKRLKQVNSSKVFLIILILLACFRYGVGNDYFSYNYLFQRISNNPIQEIKYGLDNQEIGFRLIQSIFKYFGASYQLTVAIFSVITLLYMYRLCDRYSKNTTLSLLVYYSCFYFVWTFSGYRQSIVIFIGLYYLLVCSENKNPMKFILITLILASIHSSAYLLLVFYIILTLNINKKVYIFILALCVLQSLVPVSIFERILYKIPYLKGISFYLNNDSISWGLNFQSLPRLIFCAIIIYIYDPYIKVFKNQKKLLDIFLFSMIIYFTFKFRETIAGRLSVFGMIIFCIILSNLTTGLINKYKFVYLSLFITFLFAYMQKNLVENNKDLYIGSNNKIFVPYTNVFNKSEYRFKSKYFELIE